MLITETHLFVVDTGLPGNGEKIANYIKGLGKNPADLSYVILTHGDMDHVGSAAEVRRLTGAKLVIHFEDAAVLSGKGRPKKVKGPLGLLFKLMSRATHFETAEPDVVLAEDCEIDGLKVVHTPGHTDGSISLYVPGRAIFVGDALRADSKGNPKGPASNFTADMVRAKASLITISQLQFDTLLPGHGAPVVDQASAKVNSLLTRLK